jgi:hypothetical protein
MTLGMAPQDYEYLFGAANLAHNHLKWDFTILVDRLKIFLLGHRFYKSDGMGSFEVVTKKVDLNACMLRMIPKHRVMVHVICIGQSTDPATIYLVALRQRDSNNIVVVSMMTTITTINVNDT